MAGDASAPPAIERVLEAAAAGAQASCYQVLGLAASAAAGDVRRAYLSLALQVRKFDLSFCLFNALSHEKEEFRKYVQLQGGGQVERCVQPWDKVKASCRGTKGKLQSWIMHPDLSRIPVRDMGPCFSSRDLIRVVPEARLLI